MEQSKVMEYENWKASLDVLNPHTMYRMFNLKVDRQLSHEYFTSDAIYNGSDSMTF